MDKERGLKLPPFSQRLQKEEMGARGSLGLGTCRSLLQVVGLGGLENTIQCRAVFFSDVDSQEGLAHRRGWDRSGENRPVSTTDLCWKVARAQAAVMGAQVLNLPLHTDGLKPEQLLKLFPLSVR